MAEPIVEIKELKVHFPIRAGLFMKKVGAIHAVDGITLDIIPNKTFGLVGESGCGKTTTGRCCLGLLPPTSGHVHFMGVDLYKSPKKEVHKLRKEMGMIFQDPFSSLNPRWTVGNFIAEPLQIHKIATTRQEQKKRVAELLKKVGLSARHVTRYPHEFSGGQRQRIAIARALASQPKFIIADEPVAALDISIRADILNLMRELKKEIGVNYLFISHDLSVIRYICDRVAVMYLGKIVEFAPVEMLFNNPQHPYTQALISAVPIPDPTVKPKRIILHGEVPSPVNPPKGCRFNPRCQYRTSRCKEEDPKLIETENGHYVACHKYLPF